MSPERRQRDDVSSGGFQVTVALAEARASVRAGRIGAGRRHGLRTADWVTGAAFLAFALFLLKGLWGNTGSGFLTLSGNDQYMFEWFFAEVAHSVTNGQNPLGTTLQNYPFGINNMANTAVFGLSIPLIPITLAFGPTVSFVLALTFGLAGTAFGWYWFYTRFVGAHPVAAALGGALCGFAPAMVSHTNGHVNFAFAALLPWIAMRLVAATASVRPVRDGIVLGLLVAWQIFIGEEPLLIFAFGVGAFVIGYAIFDRTHFVECAKAAFRPLAIGVGVTLALVGFPLWWQFFGPQAYHGLGHGRADNDLFEFLQFPMNSIGYQLWPGEKLSVNATEHNAYFGWPLLVLIAVAAFALWSRKVVRAAVVAILAMVVLSLGRELTVGGDDTGIWMPWSLFYQLPLLDSLMELRLAMACLPFLGLLLAMAVDAAIKHGDRRVTIAGVAGAVLALLPITPLPLPTKEKPAVPEFITAGLWKDYVDDGSVVFVPLPSGSRGFPLDWQAKADFGFPLAQGYFLGPDGEGAGRYAPNPRASGDLFARVARTGKVPTISDAQRLTFISDLKYWDADVVILPDVKYADELNRVLTQLFGRPGTYAGGVWVWSFDL